MKMSLLLRYQWLSIAICVVWILSLFRASSGKNIYVSNSFSDVTCNATSFNCPDMISAIDISQSNDTIYIHQGIYTGPNNTGICFNNLSDNFNNCPLLNNVSFIGLGPPETVVFRMSNDTLKYRQWVYENVFYSYSNSIQMISNMSFENFLSKDLNDVYDSSVNGAIHVAFTDMSMRHLVFLNNSARIGAAIASYRSNISISNSLFINNTVSLEGGAVYGLLSNFIITDSIFVNNNASSHRPSDSASGGAVYSNGGELSLIIQNSVFRNNSAQRAGGAISFLSNSLIKEKTIRESGKFVANNCHFEGNLVTGQSMCLSASSCSARGGALFLSALTIQIFDSLFIQNEAHTLSDSFPVDGGAVYSTDLLGTVSKKEYAISFINCTFEKNLAEGRGGAIFTTNQALQVSNCQFLENKATSLDVLFSDQPAQGGAIWYSGEYVSNSIINSLFRLNMVTSGQGGAFYASQSLNGNFDITNSTFEGNQAISSYVFSAQGGALTVAGTFNMLISNCLFFDNLAVPNTGVDPETLSGSGGALYLQSTDLQIVESRFIKNYAVTGQFDSGSTGGAMFLENSNPANISNCQFEQNGAFGYYKFSSFASPGSGGAIYLKFSVALIEDSSFLANWASAGISTESLGGAIAVFFDYSSVSNKYESIEIINTNFVNNSATSQICVSDKQSGFGGALAILGTKNPALVLMNVLFQSNIAMSKSATPSLGGAIYVTLSSSLSANNASFLMNAAISGAGNDVISMSSEGGESNYLDFIDSYFSSASLTQQIVIKDSYDQQEQYFCSQLNAIGAGLSSVLPSPYALRKPLEMAPNSLLNGQFGTFERKERIYRGMEVPRAENWQLKQTLAETDENLALKMFFSSRKAILEEKLQALSDHNLTYPFPLSSTKDLYFFEFYQLEKEYVEANLASLSKHGKDFLGKEDVRRSPHVVSVSDQSSFQFDMKNLSNLIVTQPSIISTSGICTFINPIFNGSYEYFIGNFKYVLAILSGSSSTLEDYAPSQAIIRGDLQQNGLTITIFQGQLNISNSNEAKSQSISHLHLFNSTIYLHDTLIVTKEALLDNATMHGVKSSSANFNMSWTIPKIIFQKSIFLGYSLGDLLSSKTSSLPYFFNNVRSSQISTLTLDSCNLVVNHDLVLDSPQMEVNAENLQPNFLDSKIILKLINKAFINISAGARMDIYTQTIVNSVDSSAIGIWNGGTIALIGKTKPLFTSQFKIVPVRLGPEAQKGSLESTLTITGDFYQTSSGNVLIYLNSTHQNRPVLNLKDNNHLYGTIQVKFFISETLNIYPQIQLYSQDVSSWDIISYTNYSSLKRKDYSILAPEGLKFSKSYKQIDRKISEQMPQSYVDYITITNIACNQINKYYYQVPDSINKNSYPCYVCLMNTSCDLCASGDCSLAGSCAKQGGIKFSDNCCESCDGNKGSCESNEDHTSYQCDCKFFYDGSECTHLSLNAYLIIISAVSLAVIFFVGIVFYWRSLKQKKLVLDELRDGILRHSSTNNEYIKNIQQALILNDVFVKFEEIKLESIVGEGSFGVVYKATFRGAQVAVKKMRSMFFELSEKDIEEFRKEAYVMCRLRHPNIVLVMGISLVDQEPVSMPQSRTQNSLPMDDSMLRGSAVDVKKAAPQKTVCIITEYLDQGSLSDILYGPTKLPAEIWSYELILTCALQAARGMLYLHSHNPPICHRDLKSSNLVVDDHWVVKVTDFGMSRIVPQNIQNIEKGIEKDEDYHYRDSIGRESMGMDPLENEESEFSKHSFLIRSTHARSSLLSPEMTTNLGTTAWCAPEVLTSASKAHYSVKVDVYSYGMVLWELWEKKRPFEELSSRFDIMDAVKSGKRPKISENCPPTFKSLIQRCWQTDPNRRPMFKYIVRYLKDELARVKRQKAASIQMGGVPVMTPLIFPDATRSDVTPTFTPSQLLGDRSSTYGISNTSYSASNPMIGSLGSASKHEDSMDPTKHSAGDASDEEAPRGSFLRRSFAAAVQQFGLGGKQSDVNRESNNSNRSSTSIKSTKSNKSNKSSKNNKAETTGQRFQFLGRSSNVDRNNPPTTSSDFAANRHNIADPASRIAASAYNPNGGEDTDTSAGYDVGQNAANYPNIPEGRTPLVAAFDRSLSYLTESPAVFSSMMPSPAINSSNSHMTPSSSSSGPNSPGNPNSNNRGSGRQSNLWREKYVMKLSGWKSTNPDSGLPPSLTYGATGTPNSYPVPSLDRKDSTYSEQGIKMTLSNRSEKDEDAQDQPASSAEAKQAKPTKKSQSSANRRQSPARNAPSKLKDGKPTDDDDESGIFDIDDP